MLSKLVSTTAIGSVAMAREQITPMRVDSSSRVLTDLKGRQVLLHGVNVVPKVPPYIPITDKFEPLTSLSEEDMEHLTSWGMNFIRLGVMWEAVEREPQKYDMEYLDKIEALINKLGEKGFYVLVDAHQDIAVRKLCGEGFPNFYATDMNHECDQLITNLMWWVGMCKNVDDYAWRRDADGNPLFEDCQKTTFFKYYLMPETLSVFENFYTNKNGMQDRFMDYWSVVSKRFAGNPYIVGYDPINEPWPSTLFSDPYLQMQDGGFDKKRLTPLYKKTFDIYQKDDAEKLMWFEPIQFPDTFAAFGGVVFPIGFDSLPGGNENADKHVLNDHTYCCETGPDVCAKGEPPLELAPQCRAFHHKRMQQRLKDAERLNVPLIITEFGACFDSESCAQEIKSVTDSCDEVLASWTYWQFKSYWDFTTTAGAGNEGFYNNDGTPQNKKISALTRSYLPYTQGRIEKMHFDSETGKFEAVFTLDIGIEAATVLYSAEEHWFNQINSVVSLQHEGVELTPEQVEISKEKPYTYFKVVDETLDKQSIRVQITPVSALAI